MSDTVDFVITNENWDQNFDCGGTARFCRGAWKNVCFNSTLVLLRLLSTPLRLQVTFIRVYFAYLEKNATHGRDKDVL